ncbi:hypothetical protein [Bradyrhizobium quebecense]|uniref:Uncharacterized protein n=2 Tax=Bradyrhizobium quebecense TaxID=2748629 RepID=A0ACD3V7K9_9BRAD|nr:hypothetical protein [Bradyrhizobium quebecense]UGY02478.1 hypothetical protein J4P68_0036225 [Bradyrhizobium quebecense]
MIVNVPTPQALNDVALRLYFSAWSSLIYIRAHFDQTFPPGEDPRPEKGDWAEEWSEYIQGYQPEFQAVCSVIQQSNELALKAKICAVSPYLLLLNSNPKFSAVPGDIDFSELRTIDASDLPASVNSLCKKALSDDYVRTYNEIRSLRNKIAHLGHAGSNFEPDKLLEILVDQYIELWSDRAWLTDRVNFASRTGLAFFQDGKYTSAAAEVMYELPLILAAVKKSAFKKLFGIEKTTRRYLCHACVADASVRYHEVDPVRCRTAYLKDKSTLHCLMCSADYPVVREACGTDKCKGNVISRSEHADCAVCHTCGSEQSERRGS